MNKYSVGDKIVLRSDSWNEEEEVEVISVEESNAPFALAGKFIYRLRTERGTIYTMSDIRLGNQIKS